MKTVFEVLDDIITVSNNDHRIDNFIGHTELEFLNCAKPMYDEDYNVIYGIIKAKNESEVHGAILSVILKIKSPSLKKAKIGRYISVVDAIISDLKAMTDNEIFEYYLYGAHKMFTTSTLFNFIFAATVLDEIKDLKLLSDEDDAYLTVPEVDSLENEYSYYSSGFKSKIGTSEGDIEALKILRHARSVTSEQIDKDQNFYLVMYREYRKRELMRGAPEMVMIDDTPEMADVSTEDDRSITVKTAVGVLYYLSQYKKQKIRLPMIAFYLFNHGDKNKKWKEEQLNYNTFYKYFNQIRSTIKNKLTFDRITKTLVNQFGFEQTEIDRITTEIQGGSK